MGRHAHATQKWAYSAEQMAAALQNPDHRRYKQGMVDALRAVSRLEDGAIEVQTLQTLLDGLPNTWDQTVESAYVVGFEDMYGILAETLSTEYAPEAVKVQPLQENTQPEAASGA